MIGQHLFGLLPVNFKALSLYGLIFISFPEFGILRVQSKK